MVNLEEQTHLLERLKSCLEEEAHILKRGTPEEILWLNHQKEKLLRELNQGPLVTLTKEKVLTWIASQPKGSQEQFQDILGLLKEVQGLNQRTKVYSEAGLMYTKQAIDWFKKPLVHQATYTAQGARKENVMSSSCLISRTI